MPGKRQPNAVKKIEMGAQTNMTGGHLDH